MRRRYLPIAFVAVPALALCVGTAGCGVSAEEKRDARETFESRGFTVLSLTVEFGEISFLDVAFGTCVGRITYYHDPQNTYLTVEVPVSGAPDNTAEVRIDDPDVDKLRKTPALAGNCFKP